MNTITPDMICRHDRQIPRYTSYPPATRFVKGEGAGLYADWLSRAAGDVSLYIHIPFCARLCYYCGCHMKVVNGYDPIAGYLETLKQEMRLVRSRMPATAQVTHIHFGGGSPTSVKPKDFSALMKDIRAVFTVTSDAQISLEADPRNMTEAKIAAYAKSGVTRISLGVQDFDDRVLKTINRPQPFATTYDAVKLCRAYGIREINFDLMYGLPYQTVEGIRRTVTAATLLKPDRIAFFGYAHVPWMKRHMNLIPPESLPQALDRCMLYQCGYETLIAAGYKAVGIDHFVAPRDGMDVSAVNRRLKRNFQGYTTDTAPILIGLGLSSIGEFADGYVQNDPDFKGYKESVEAGKLPAARFLTYSGEDKIRKEIIGRLMCYLDVDLSDIRESWGLPAGHFSQALERLTPLAREGIVHMEGEIVSVNPEARILTRIVCEAFDEYASRDDHMQRHARAI